MWRKVHGPQFMDPLWLLQQETTWGLTAAAAAAAATLYLENIKGQWPLQFHYLTFYRIKHQKGKNMLRELEFWWPKLWNIKKEKAMDHWLSPLLVTRLSRYVFLILISHYSYQVLFSLHLPISLNYSNFFLVLLFLGETFLFPCFFVFLDNLGQMLLGPKQSNALSLVYCITPTNWW